ncbi:hypothetical protein TV39_02925 [Arthrobacter sp. SPG23]|uniref:hypothetical protein n=1 Tax=Arthrobacter sp. SPG23 TaxID=1610703 RepID=UPI0005B9B68E|nr:hypothetical protein [Arthrobacter sp. SPG23]KIS28835.1 hypothetical protein TV39_02925 [Arthrobacter sp. SPG23]
MPTSFPAAQPAHPLDYWLSPELARISPPTAPSRLRQLADAQGALAAAWSSAIGSGPLLILGGGFITVMSGNPVWVLVLGLTGAALMVLGRYSWKRVRTSLPNTDSLLITRGPGTARGGVVMVSLLAALVGGILATGLPASAARGTATLVALVGAYVLIVALLAVCILVPSVVMGRARQSFRRRVQADPTLRAAVEEDLATWRDPYGNAGYGPL